MRFAAWTFLSVRDEAARIEIKSPFRLVKVSLVRGEIALQVWLPDLLEVDIQTAESRTVCRFLGWRSDVDSCEIATGGWDPQLSEDLVAERLPDI